MLFVVLAQGYLIVIGSLSTSYVGILSVGLVVGVTVGTVSYVAEPRLATKGRT